MPRRLRENTENFDKRTGRPKGSGFVPRFISMKERNETNIGVIDDIGSECKVAARFRDLLVSELNVGERLCAETLRVSKKLAIAEKMW